ncbi:MAG: hypothetical protein Q7T71_03330 [Herbiconiux sp.]|nr:hypothetical protein [Herbiconiux sp.]
MGSTLEGERERRVITAFRALAKFYAGTANIMSMSRRLICSSISAISLLCLMTGCSAGTDFPVRLLEELQLPGSGPLVLGGLVEPTSAQFLVVCPGDSSDSVRERIGFDWRDAPDFAGVVSAQMVVQVSDGRVIASDEMDRTPIDFCRGASAWPLLPVSSVLTVTEIDDNTWAINAG